MPFDPNTDHAERAAADPAAAYALLAARWSELLSWLGDSPNVPEIQSQRDSWADFRKRHEDAQPALSWLIPGYGPYKILTARDHLDELQGQRLQLANAESLAAAHGYRVSQWTIGEDGNVSRVDSAAPTGKASPGPTTPAEARKTGPTAPIVAPPAGPSLETLHPVATWIDQNAPGLPGAPRGDSGPKPKGPADDPYLVPKFAAVGALALGTVVGALTSRGDAQRIGVAAGGSILTAAAAALLFWPSKEAPK